MRFTHERASDLFRVATAAAVFAAVMLAAVQGVQASDAIGPARAAQLERLVRHDCGSCHGMTLKGGLGPDIRAWRYRGLPPQAVAGVILDGVPGTPMPPWRPLLSEKEALWIANYLLKVEAR